MDHNIQMDGRDQKNLKLLFHRLALLGMLIILNGVVFAQSPVVQATTPPSTQARQASALQAQQEEFQQKRKIVRQVEGTKDASGQVDKELPGDREASVVSQKDSLEMFNRAMFKFNDLVDIYIAKPVATFYNLIMFKPLNQGIHNFFNNMEELPTIANDILQFNLYQTLNDSWRFVINTTLGIGGIFDIASRLDLPYYENDFGITLALWGYGDSTYIVLPFWGPRTVRDGLIGLPVDYYAFSLYPHIYPLRTRYGLYALSVLDARAQLLLFQPVIEEAAVDKYVFMRNAYLQRRAFQIKQAQIWGPKQIAGIPF